MGEGSLTGKPHRILLGYKMAYKPLRLRKGIGTWGFKRRKEIHGKMRKGNVW